ncbi:MAG: ASCH domain-containing protein [Pseudonocardiaceae bacterium]
MIALPAGRPGSGNACTVLPAIKFFKNAVEDILAGRKTLEPRPRSLSWIRRLEKVGQASLTYGPRFGAPTFFATARITDITLRSFDTATPEDLRRIGYNWTNRSCEEFVAEYTRWFARELEKGYPVAWISFQVIDQ